MQAAHLLSMFTMHDLGGSEHAGHQTRARATRACLPVIWFEGTSGLRHQLPSLQVLTSGIETAKTTFRGGFTEESSRQRIIDTDNEAGSFDPTPYDLTTRSV